MEGFDKHDGNDHSEREEIFSKAVRAGKRTYFFDVKATRKNDYYLTITESKKCQDGEGTFHYEKHKIFLYKEDFDKFKDGLFEAVGFIESSQLETEDNESFDLINSESTVEYTNVDFEDLNR